MLQRTYSSTPPNNCNNGIVNEPGTTPVLSYKQVERHIYGSSRIGLDVTEREMIGAAAPGSTEFERVLGYKQFEAVNHLGNVLVVFTDVKIPRDDNNDLTVDYFQPFVLSSQDYSPFGVQLSGRKFESEKFRYAFNGMEKDDELKGVGNSYTTEFRQYDSRLGRWLSTDPLYAEFPWQSVYVALDNNPILLVDPTGQSATNYEDEAGKPLASTNDGSDATVTIKQDKVQEFLTEFQKNQKSSSNFNVSPMAQESYNRRFGAPKKPSSSNKNDGGLLGNGKTSGSSSNPNRSTAATSETSSGNLLPEFSQEFSFGVTLSEQMFVAAATDASLITPKYKAPKNMPPSDPNMLKYAARTVQKISTAYTVVDKSIKVVNYLDRGEYVKAGEQGVAALGYTVSAAMLSAPTGIIQIAGGILLGITFAYDYMID